MIKIKVNSDSVINFSDSGDLVYFNVNIRELFNVSLNYPGMRGAVRRAFNSSRTKVPVKTGLMKKSYTLEYTSQDTIQMFFDPAKILGQSYMGRIVKDYYPKYLRNTAKRFNWLDIIIKTFYQTLMVEVKKLQKKEVKKDKTKKAIASVTTAGVIMRDRSIDDIGNIDMMGALLFMNQFKEKYEDKKEKYIESQSKGVVNK